MDFTSLFQQNWEGIFVCLGPGLAIGKIAELIIAQFKRSKQWADIAEKVVGMTVSMVMGFVLLHGLKMPLEPVLLIVSFSLLVHTGYIGITSWLKKGAKLRAKD